MPGTRFGVRHMARRYALTGGAVMAVVLAGTPADAQAPPAAAQPAAQAPARPPAPPPLLGAVTEADLRGYAPWQPYFATPYEPDAAAVGTIKAQARSVTVFSIVATWCPDSRREVPRFLAIMNAAGFPASAVTMIGVDRTKKDAEGLTGKWGITRVPTFVFLREGREVGRVVERTPDGATLEAEIARILSGGQLD